MAAQELDTRDKLVGRRLVGVATPINDSKESRLFRYFGEVPKQRSIVVYTNGDVTEREEFTQTELNAPNVYAYIQGGTDYRRTDDEWLNTALEDQGYTFEPYDS
jgi:putative lipase involved disintegration of autophagic bodies